MRWTCHCWGVTPSCSGMIFISKLLILSPPRRTSLELSCASIFMTFIGIAPSYHVLIVILLIGGLGVSAFHPHAASTAGDVAGTGKNRDFSLAVFMAIGTIGYALGPLFAAYLMSSPFIGPKRMPYASILGIVTTILLYKYVSLKKETGQKRESVKILQVIKPEIKLLTILFIIVALRSTTTIVYVNFLSLLIKQRELPLMIGAIVLFIFSSMNPIQNSFYSIAASLPIAITVYLIAWTMMPGGRLRLKGFFSDLTLAFKKEECRGDISVS